MSASYILEQCMKKGFTIGFAESMTGGKAIASLIEIPGASKVVLGGIVAYSKSLKEKLLEVNPKVIDTYGTVSSEVALAMALGIKKVTGATISIGITGNAGPDKEPGIQELICYIAILYHDQKYEMKLIFENLSREEAIDDAVEATLEKLKELLS